MESFEREELLAWYRRNRRRSQVLFDMLVGDDVYYSRPIALRHPIVFYEGHLPAFSFNTLVKAGLGKPSIDAKLESLFARGIDPAEDGAETKDTCNRELWPDRSAVREFAEAADAAVVHALAHDDIERADHPLLDRAEAAFTILEHEAMH
jgi:gamma-glutamyl hercynylcysteine S-oxide synthase